MNNNLKTTFAFPLPQKMGTATSTSRGARKREAPGRRNDHKGTAESHTLLGPLSSWIRKAPPSKPPSGKQSHQRYLPTTTTTARRARRPVTTTTKTSHASWRRATSPTSRDLNAKQVLTGTAVVGSAAAVCYWAFAHHQSSSSPSSTPSVGSSSSSSASSSPSSTSLSPSPSVDTAASSSDSYPVGISPPALGSEPSGAATDSSESVVAVGDVASQTSTASSTPSIIAADAAAVEGAADNELQQPDASEAASAAVEGIHTADTACDTTAAALRASQPFEATESFDLSPTLRLWDPFVAADPRSDQCYMICTRLSNASSSSSSSSSSERALLRTSSDGGQHFRGPRWFPSFGLYRQGHHMLAVPRDGKGVVYAAFWGCTSQHPERSFVGFTKSTTQGHSWAPLTIANTGDRLATVEKPWIVVSPDGQLVHIAYYGADNQVLPTRFRAFVVTSRDGGVHFDRPVQISDDLRNRKWLCMGGTSAPGDRMNYPRHNNDNNISSSTTNTNTSGRIRARHIPFFAFALEHAESGVAAASTTEISVVKSSDGGRTWDVDRFMQNRPAWFVSLPGPAPMLPPPCPEDFFNAQASLAADVQGQVMLVFARADQFRGQTDLYYSLLTEGGSGWTRPELVIGGNRRGGSGRSRHHEHQRRRGNQNFPQLCAHPSEPGDFRLIWMDNRDGEQAYNTYFSRYSSLERRWSQEDVLLSTPSAEHHDEGFPMPFGEYAGIAVTQSGHTLAAWGAGDNWKTTGKVWFTRSST